MNIKMVNRDNNSSEKTTTRCDRVPSKVGRDRAASSALPLIQSLAQATILIMAAAWLLGPFQVQAEHALSEVWSEGDGLQLKYQTHHDDMMGAKGSELSLTSTNNEQKVAGHQAEPTNEEPTSNQDESSNEATNSEQVPEGSANTDSGADSSSRQATNMKVPLSRKLAAQSSADSEENSSSSPDTEATSKSYNQDTSSDEDSDAPVASKSQELPRYESALDQVEGQAGGSSDETANLEPGSDTDSESNSERSTGGRFRSPGRLYKEAVRSTDEEKPVDQEEDGQQTSGRPTEAADEQEERGPSGEASADEPQNSLGARQNMIDFDQVANSLGRQRSQAARPNDGYGQGAGEHEGRAAASEDRPLRPQVGGAPRAPMRQSIGGQMRFNGRQRNAALPATRTEGGYFRALDREQQNTRLVSPDSERDNFISPGHYPGSMSHLTQAASEASKKELPASEVAVKAEDSRANGPKPDETPEPKQAEEEPAKIPEPVAELEAPPTPTNQQLVTPEPALQPESQQIMAPILISTTTMAPMASTSAPVATQTGAQQNSTVTDGKAAALKRYKFRKFK